jgi:hypothetical protein
MTIDVRYIGTQARKLLGDININTNNIYYNQELLDALTVTRNGGESALLTQMLAGLNLGNGVIGQATTGSQALRASTTFNQNHIYVVQIDEHRCRWQQQSIEPASGLSQGIQ